jgi:hypothetical protein
MKCDKNQQLKDDLRDMTTALGRQPQEHQMNTKRSLRHEISPTSSKHIQTHSNPMDPNISLEITYSSGSYRNPLITTVHKLKHIQILPKKVLGSIV